MLDLNLLMLFNSIEMRGNEQNWDASCVEENTWSAWINLFPRTIHFLDNLIDAYSLLKLHMTKKQTQPSE
jgi:hypothetical protein